MERRKKVLTEEGERKDRIIQQSGKQHLMSVYQGDIRAEDEQTTAEIDQLKVVHSSEVEQLQLQIRDLNTRSQLVTAKMEAELAESKSYGTLYEQSELQLAQERETSKKLMADKYDFQSELSESQLENTILQCTISKLQADISGLKISGHKHDSNFSFCVELL